jgi:phage baseplate assembly protein W
MSDSDFLGVGWNFPIGLDDNRQDGYHPIQLVPDGVDGIRLSILMILRTSPGERMMRPDFGCGLQDAVFGVNNASTANDIAGAVREALALWEPRIDVLDIYAAPDATDANLLLIEINYQVRSTNSRFNLVYPFYLE